MSCFVSPNVIGNGLVLYLDAANQKSYPGSGTVWSDLSGNSLNASLVNSVGYSIENNGAMTFNGVDGYASINFIRTPSAVTYEVFIKPSNVSKDQMYIGSASSANYVRIANSASFFSVQTSVGQRTLAHSQTLLNNTVYHIVSIYNGVQLKIYVNNNLTSGTEINQALTNANIDRIGRWRDADQRSFVGNMYCLKIYDRELSEQEILQNFNALRGRYGV